MCTRPVRRDTGGAGGCVSAHTECLCPRSPAHVNNGFEWQTAPKKPRALQWRLCFLSSHCGGQRAHCNWQSGGGCKEGVGLRADTWHWRSRRREEVIKLWPEYTPTLKMSVIDILFMWNQGMNVQLSLWETLWQISGAETNRRNQVIYWWLDETWFLNSSFVKPRSCMIKPHRCFHFSAWLHQDTRRGRVLIWLISLSLIAPVGLVAPVWAERRLHLFIFLLE